MYYNIENEISNDGIIEFSKSLQYIHHLTSLYISGILYLIIIENKINDNGFKNIANNLPICKSLHFIYIGGNVINNYDEIKAIIQKAHPNKSLKVIETIKQNQEI